MFRCDQNGPPARREEGAYLKAIRNRRATQPPAHFHRNPPGPRPVGLFFGVARSLRIKSRYARRSRLEKQPTDQRRNINVFRGQDTNAETT